MTTMAMRKMISGSQPTARLVVDLDAQVLDAAGVEP